MEAQQAANRKKIEAEANAEVLKTEADAEAYRTRVKAEAEAEANKQIAESITKDLINYVQVKNWNGNLPQTVLGSDTVLPIINTTPEFSEFFNEEDIEE